VDLPPNTLKARLGAACAALDALGCDREKWRTDSDALEAALKVVDAARTMLAAERHGRPDQPADPEDDVRRSEIAGAKLVVGRDRMADELAVSRKIAGELRTAYGLLAEALTTLVVRLSAVEAQRDASSNDLAVLKGVLAELRDEGRTQIAAHRDNYEADIAAARARQQAAEERLGRVLGSRSWRITRPLRKVRRAARAAAAIVRGARHPLQRISERFTGLVSRSMAVLGRLTYGAVRGLGNAALDRLTQAAAWWRMHLGRPRTMWGVTPILTLPLLARCDRLLGLHSESLVFTTYHVTKNFDINLQRLSKAIYTRHSRWSGPMHKIILRLALIRYDAFHLFCDRGLMPPTRRMEINEREMGAMRQHGRRLYTYTYGADVRTRTATLALGRYNLCIDCPEPMKFCMCDDAEGCDNIARIRASATMMMAMGDMLAYVPDARNFHFWPIDTGQVRYVGTDWSKNRVLRVAHAPNHAHFKGTQYLVRAIERLRSEGHAVELIQVQGVPNSEVMALFASCDLVADQFIAGFHGYTALEAMALGKPVLCYLRDPDMAIDPASCPIINVWPDTVYDTLKDCLEGRHDLAALGRRSRSYVEHYYSLEAVALRLGQLYLATAGFSTRINRKISRRLAVLEPLLPPLLPGTPPVPWSAAIAVNGRASRVA
jgi:hypothetical protein